LDYGCGSDSVISKLLSEKKYIISKFDPFYENNPKVLENKYDFIIACEVVEHFHFPKEEFQSLKVLLKANGELLIMTHLYDSSIDFEKWYYKNDFTHVFFYTEETFEWIQKEYVFSKLEINGRFIRLRN
jgi:SAM-dependent methyltransferase